MHFDDGYANNLRLSKVLAEFDVPATVFISTRHVQNQRGFWWDVVYRHGRKQGKNHGEIIQKQRALKTQPWAMNEREVEVLVGTQGFVPQSDADRPMSIDELKDFSREPRIELGNHTANHAILTQCDDSEAEAQLRCAQNDLTDWTGQAPLWFRIPMETFLSEKSIFHNVLTRIRHYNHSPSRANAIER